MAARAVARNASPVSSKHQSPRSQSRAVARQAPVTAPAPVALPTRQEIAARVNEARDAIFQARAVVETAALATHGLEGGRNDSATLRRVLHEASGILDRACDQLDPLALLKA